MISEDISVQLAIEQQSNHFLDLMRYYLSDKVIKTVESVCVGNHSPTSYAHYITAKNWKSVFQKFGSEIIRNNEPPPELIQKAWVYDRTLEVSAFYRASKVRPNLVSDSASLFYTSFPHTLILSNTQLSEGLWGGLTYFESNATTFFEHYFVNRILEDIGLITRLCKTIGNIDEPSWLFHNPVWLKTLSSDQEILKALRGFLHTALVCHISKDDYLRQNYGLTRKELSDHIIRFIDICEDESTSSKDIRHFISDVESFSLESYHNDFLTAFYELPYTRFEKEHASIFGSRYALKIPPRINDDHDREEWKALRDISSEFTPEKIIETDALINEFVDDLLKNHALDIFKGPLNIICKNKDIPLPRSITKEWNWLKAFMKDQLYCSLVSRRLSHLNRVSPDKVDDAVSYQSHLLLILEDSEERSGLSLVKETLNQHVENNITKYSSYEQEVLQTLVWAWSKLNINKPNRMDKSWKLVLKEKSIRRELRTLMFAIIEAINIPWGEDDKSFISWSKELLFHHIEIFCEYVSGTPSLEELTEFFQEMPKFRTPICLTKWDIGIWILPFSTIPLPENDLEELEMINE